MTALVVRLRSEARARWRGWLGLALLLALAGGAATAAAAGGRRTETAYPRFFAAARGHDLITGGFPEKIDPEKALATMARLPSVKDSARVDTVSFGGFLPSGPKLVIPQLFAVTDFHARLGSRIDRFKVLSGRLFDLKAPDEAMIDFGMADRYGLRLGDVIKLIAGDPADPTSKTAPVRIVGIVAYPGVFPAVGISLSLLEPVIVTPAFAPANGITPSAEESSLLIRLKGGPASLGAFQREMAKAGLGGVDLPIVSAVQTVAVQRSIRFESQALWALAALIGLATLAIFGQALVRQVYSDSDEFPTLLAVGFSRKQLVALGVLRSAFIGTLAALLTVPVAILFSPLTPIGLARLAEPHPGIWIDGVALALGAVLVLGTAVAVSAVPAYTVARSVARGVRAWPGAGRPSRVADTLTRASSSPVAAAGLRMALEPGRGRTAVPVRSTIFGAVLSVAALMSALMFASSLHHVLVTPRLSGFTWDAFVSDEQTQAATAKALRADPRIAGFSRGGYVNVKVDGTSLFCLVTDGSGPVRPIIAEGRAPAGADEIAVGLATLGATHKAIGDPVEVVEDQEDAAPPVRMRIVGTVIMPPAAFGATRPGEGAAFTLAGATRLDPTAPDQIAQGPFLVTYRPGVSRVDGLAAVLEDSPNAFVVQSERPGDVSSLSRISNVPVLLAGLLAVVAIGTLAHTLVTSTRRRRRDVAILKTIGFVRGQVAGTVAWQATTLALLALIAGIPIGIAAGRWGWTFFAEQLGVLPAPIVPVIAILVVAPAALLLANLIAFVPGRIASRVRPAVVLRAE